MIGNIWNTAKMINTTYNNPYATLFPADDKGELVFFTGSAFDFVCNVLITFPPFTLVIQVIFRSSKLSNYPCNHQTNN